MTIFAWIYFGAIVVEMVIRAPISRKQRKEPKTNRQVTTQEIISLGLLFVAMLFIPIIYVSTHWLDFANYTLPVWANWLGVIIIILALFVFWRSHADLGLNWSPSLEIREKHELITRGVYSIIRHPMYASQWLWVIAQPLLLPNWIAGFLNIVVFIFFYTMRVKAEEKLMLEQFGDQYRSYMQTVGAVFPKFKV
ncbi:MAG: isoprenylcysteine carboxylmethyltransferase family protein [Anaerolineales bacterium]|nr:isoprenylcysteine carboxylmethyltransferase family protein [Anaerolineales bacterium]